MHERWDGKGYPKGLKADEIPLESRIIAIADALEELKLNAGTQFDSELVSLFVDKVMWYGFG